MLMIQQYSSEAWETLPWFTLVYSVVKRLENEPRGLKSTGNGDGKPEPEQEEQNQEDSDGNAEI
jgi:hypothetical protein